MSANTPERKNLSSGVVDRGGGAREEGTGDEGGWQACCTLDKGAGELLADTAEAAEPPGEVDGLMDESDRRERGAGGVTGGVVVDGRETDGSDKILVDGWSTLAVGGLTAQAHNFLMDPGEF